MRQPRPEEAIASAGVSARQRVAEWTVVPAAAFEASLDDGARPHSCRPRDKRLAVESAGLVAVWFLSKWIVVRKESLDAGFTSAQQKLP
jgi:hypothetical protein